MQLQPGTKLGPYEILAPLGAGGMGAGSVRFSLGRYTTREEIDQAVRLIKANLHSSIKAL